MHKHPAQTIQRIQKTLDLIESKIYGARAPLELAAWHVQGEPVASEKAFEAEYVAFRVGGAWGPRWSTTWFRLRGEVPAEWAGREVVVLMRLTRESWEGFTAEGLIYVNRVPVRALNINRADIEIVKSAVGSERFEIFVEAASNGGVDPFGVGSGDLLLPDPTGKPLFVVAQAELACLDRAAFDYYYDYKVAAQAMEALPEDSQRRGELLYALNESVNRYDHSDLTTIASARAALKEVLAKRNGDTVHTISAIGHAHIDTAWLWPLRETIRKCARTFSTALDYMDKYPEYVFGCSQPQQYAWMKVYYPEIYTRIKAAVVRGQWEPIGSMWVEADCNLASGESLIRQILNGKRFFKEEFNYETRDVWIPDVFGYSAALPQIMCQSGVDSFLTQKISWSQFNKFPHHTFLWEGIDGSQIFSHFLPADTYNADTGPKELLKNVNNFKEHDRASRSLLVYGFGDGGGGPSIAMLEQAKRLKDFNGLPKLELEKVTSFFSKAKADARDLPVWVGELYLEYHRGTYTSQAHNKLGNRKSEILLRDAEFFDAISRALSPNRNETAVSPRRAVYDVTGIGDTDSNTHRAALDRAWKLLLLNQFHDIIPGTSIHWVYLDSAKDYDVISKLGNSVLESSLRTLESSVDTTEFSKPVQIVNTLNFSRQEVIEINGVLANVTVPPCGYTIVEADTISSTDHPVTASQNSEGIVLDNGLMTLQFNAKGDMIRLFDREAQREVLSPGCLGNRFQLHRDVPNMYDAWDVDIFYKETHLEIDGLESFELVDPKPLRASVSIVRRFGQSRIEQRIVLSAGSPRIDFVTSVDWQEEQKMLKVSFPVQVRSARATYEIQYGHLERPTHYNTSWDLARFEVCAQKWADFSEPGYGVALLNDSKYGYDIHGNVMRLSLLRAPNSPDPKADRGRHQFTYALLPHGGDFRDAGVIEQAYALNVPLRVRTVPVKSGVLPPTHSFFSTDCEGIIIESIKVAEDGNGFIVRLYEARGSRRSVQVSTTLPVTKVERTDLLERPIKSAEMIGCSVRCDLNPFEICTLRFTA